MIGEDRRRVEERVPGVCGLGLIVGPQSGEPGGRPDQGSVSHPGAPRAGGAERAAFGQYQPRVQLVQTVIRKSQCRKCSRLEVREDGIGGGGQFRKEFSAGGAAQIQSEAQVVAVRPGERVADRLILALLPQSVGVGRTLDLDDLRAQVAEQPAEFAAGDDDAQIHHPDPVEGSCADRTGGRRRELRCPPGGLGTAGLGRRGAITGTGAIDNPVAGRNPRAHARGQFSRGERAHCTEMFGLQYLRRGQNGGDRHAVVLTVGHQLFHRLIGEQCGNQAAEFTEGPYPGSDGVEARILELFRFSQPCPQAAPLPG